MEGNISEIPTANPTFSTMPDSTVTLPIVFDVRRLPEFKMAVSKPEVDLSRELKGLSAKFQRLPPHFRPCPTQLWQCQQSSTFADFRNSKWRPVNRKYIYLGNEKGYQRNSNCYPHIFDYARLNCGIANIVRRIFFCNSFTAGYT